MDRRTFFHVSFLSPSFQLHWVIRRYLETPRVKTLSIGPKNVPKTTLLFVRPAALAGFKRPRAVRGKACADMVHYHGTHHTTLHPNTTIQYTPLAWEEFSLAEHTRKRHRTKKSPTIPELPAPPQKQVKALKHGWSERGVGGGDTQGQNYNTKITSRPRIKNDGNRNYKISQNTAIKSETQPFGDPLETRWKPDPHDMKTKTHKKWYMTAHPSRCLTRPD